MCSIYVLLLLGPNLILAYQKTNVYYAKGDFECCRGPSGMHGNPGIPGSPGSNGLNGINGEKGQKGDTGDRGHKGDQGIGDLWCSLGLNTSLWKA